MFILRIIRYLCGYVIFQGIGGFPERFLNLCAKEGIGIWDVHHRDGVMTARVMASNYRLLRSCAAKAGMRLKVQQRHGFSFVIYRYRKRIGILVGIGLFVLILTVSSNFVWTIKVEGNEQMDSAVIMQTMEELGLRAGVMKSSLDISAMELEGLKKLEELSWLSVNIRGSVATIEVRERTMPPEMLDEKTPCNVVASADGYIVRLEAYEGSTKVRVGDSVVKGDLLISGVMESKLETTRFVHARGTVIANTNRVVETEVPLQQEKTVYLGQEKKKYALKLFGFRIPIYFSEPKEGEWEKTAEISCLNILGLELPIAFESVQYRAISKTSETITQGQAQSLAQEQIAKQIETLGDLKIIDRKEEYSFTSAVCKLKATLSCEEDISSYEKILFDDEVE